MHTTPLVRMPLIALAGVLLTAGLCPGEVTPYATDLGKPDATYTVTAGGKDVPVVRFWKGRRMARFGFSGEVTVKISTGKPVAAVEVRPRWAKVRREVEGDTLLLTLSAPQHLRVRVNDRGPLGLIAYPPHRKPAGEKVHDLSGEDGADASGKTDMSDVLQKAVDRISADGGGTLYVPPGVYRGAKDATLKLKSDVTLHLAPEAVIRQVRFLLNDVQNVRLVGQGLLDFTGAPGTNQAGCLRGNNAKKVHIEGLISTNFDYNWNTRFDKSEDVTIRDYRVFGGKDGINPVDSRRVHIRDVYIVTSDDCIATKSFSGGYDEVSDITAERCLLQCLKYGGVKIGTETNAKRFRNITYRDIEIVSAMRAAIIQLRDGADISKVTIENLTADLAWARGIDFIIQQRKGLGHIHDITVRNVNLRRVGWKNPPRLVGFNDEHKVREVTFENLRIEGELIDSKAEAAKAGFNFEHTADLKFIVPKTHIRSIRALSGALAGASKEWDSAKRLVDGDAETCADAKAERVWAELAFDEERTLAGLRVLGGNKYGAIGVGLQVPDGDGWKTVTDYRRCEGQGWSEFAFEPTTAKRFRVTFRKTPDVSTCRVREIVPLERVGT